MQFYWSWKNLPELKHRSGKEYRQILRSIGLKPFRHWQVWVAMLVASSLILLGLETLFGFLVNRTFKEDDWEIVFGVLLVICVPCLLYRHIYLQFLGFYITRAPLEPAGSWGGALLKNTAIILVPFMLIPICVFSIDWAINYYDEDLDHSFATIKIWPEPILENENGYIAMAGLMASVDASPFDAGRTYVAAVNEAILKQATMPKQPEGLRIIDYAAKTKTLDPSRPFVKDVKSAQSYFCVVGKQSCWNILRQERNEVDEWLAANKVFLARYESLKIYPRWQYPIPMNRSYTDLYYSPLVKGQSLLQAAAMRTIENGHIEQGLQMILADIVFVRRMLAGKDTMIGKLVASSMLARDIAFLAETLREYPNEAKRYLGLIEKMVEPLTAQQISVADAFRFELQFHISTFDDELFNVLLSSEIADASGKKPMFLIEKWVQHHFKKNATINWLTKNSERRTKCFEVDDVNITKPATFSEFDIVYIGNSWWHFNQVGKIVGKQIYSPGSYIYKNVLFDLNAMNNLVRLQLMLIAKSVAINDVPIFLRASERSLWNPETGKPFEWDAKQKQIYFVPASDKFINMGVGGAQGRVGVSIP